MLEPQQVSVSGWDEFICRSGLVLRGKVPAGPDDPAFEVEIPVDALHALSPDSLEQRLPHLLPYRAVHNALSEVLKGVLEPQEAAARLRQHEVGSQPVQHALEALERMRDRGADTGKPAVQQTVEALRSSVARRIHRDVHRCTSRPFFDERRGALVALRELVTTAGQNGTSVVLVCSAEQKRLAEQLDAILDACGQMGLPPDIVLWGFQVHVTMGEMKNLISMLETVRGHAAQMVTALADSEALLERAGNTEATTSLMSQDTMVPLRRLRRNPSSQSLALCAPRILVDIGASPPATCDASWLLVQHIQRMFVDEKCPLEAALPVGQDLDRSVRFGLPNRISVSADLRRFAAEAGIAVLSDTPAVGRRTALRTVANSDAVEERFTYFGYNLLHNRLWRFCAKQLTRIQSWPIAEEDIARVRERLYELILPYCQPGGEQPVSVACEDNVLHVHIEIDKHLGLPPVSFEMPIKHSSRSAS